jgi:hypothetical protein
MADVIWKTFAIEPLGFGGIATFVTWTMAGSDDPNDQILELAAFCDIAQVTDPLHLPATAVKVALDLGKNKETYFEGIPSPSCVVSWFALTPLGWQAGPVRTAINTGPSWTASYPYPKIWVVQMLQQLERESLPLGAGKTLAIRSAYPRDTFPTPCISVNFDAAPMGQQLIGDISRQINSQRIEERKGWSINISVILWAETPEERDSLIPWLGEVAQALVHLAPYQNIAEPNYHISESEDFTGSKDERPLFIGMAQITGIVWSRLEVPVRNPKGHFTI